MIAEIIINRTAKKLNRTFDYQIPKEMEEYIYIGTKVLVPFGRAKKLEEGFVVGFKEKTEYEVKEIAKIAGIIINPEKNAIPVSKIPIVNVDFSILVSFFI